MAPGYASGNPRVTLNIKIFRRFPPPPTPRLVHPARVTRARARERASVRVCVVALRYAANTLRGGVPPPRFPFATSSPAANRESLAMVDRTIRGDGILKADLNELSPRLEKCLSNEYLSPRLNRARAISPDAPSYSTPSRARLTRARYIFNINSRLSSRTRGHAANAPPRGTDGWNISVYRTYIPD